MKGLDLYQKKKRKKRKSIIKVDQERIKSQDLIASIESHVRGVTIEGQGRGVTIRDTEVALEVKEKTGVL